MSEEEENVENNEPPKLEDDPLEGDKEPKPDPIENRNNTRELIKGGLSQISKTANGSGYAYVNLSLVEKEIIDLYDLMPNYPHLRYLNISNNKIKDLNGLKSLNFLIFLNASGNQITDIDFLNEKGCLNYLQLVILSNNKIKKLTPIQVPKLRKLNLNSNRLEDLTEFKGHFALEILEIRKNRLKSLEGLKDLHNLLELYAAENYLTSFKELKNLPQLKKLHLRSNQLVNLDFELPELPHLYHLNIRENKIADLKGIINLMKYSTLLSLTMHQNPAIDEVGDGAKKEVLMILGYLNRVNKEDVVKEDRDDAKNELKERKRVEEEKRKEAEEEEKQRIEKELEEQEERRKEEEANAAANEENAKERGEGEGGEKMEGVEGEGLGIGEEEENEEEHEQEAE